MQDILRKMVLLTSSTVDDAGNITKRQSNGEVPDTIGNKRLVLATPQQLSGSIDPTWQERMLFNPLRESAAATIITPSLDWWLKGVTFRLNVTLRVLIREVLRIAASPAEHDKLTPTQLEFVTKLLDIDAPVAEFFDKSISGLAAKGEWVFVTIFPKHAGTIDGIKYNRTAHVSFPIFEELLGERKFGKNTALPKGTSLKLASVMRLLLPEIDVVDGYSAGSNSLVAPFCEASVAAVFKLCACISRQQKLWPDLWPNAETDADMAERMGIIQYSWMDYLRNTDALVNDIRAMPSVGVPEATEGVADAFTTSARPDTRVAPDRVQQAPVHQPAPPPVHQPYQPPQQQYHQPYQQQPYQQQPYNQQPQRQGGQMTFNDIMANRNRQGGRYGGGGGGYYDDRNDRYNNRGGGGWAR